MVSRGLVPLLQYRPPRVPQSVAGDPGRGATLVALSPETPDNTLSTAEKNHLDFEVLSDRGNKVAHAYGVAYKVPKIVAEQSKGRLDLAKHNGDNSGELPLGATYVVDREGRDPLRFRRRGLPQEGRAFHRARRAART